MFMTHNPKNILILLAHGLFSIVLPFHQHQKKKKRTFLQHMECCSGESSMNLWLSPDCF